mgnify:FL=1
MTRRVLSILALLASCFVGAGAAATTTTAAEAASGPSIRYLPLGAPAGRSQAVVVDQAPLVFTRQLFSTGSDGRLVGAGSIEMQSEQLLTNLETVLKDSGSSLDKLVRLHLYALSHDAADRVIEQLCKRVDSEVRPAITIVLTPLPRREALVAADAIAVAASAGRGRTLVAPKVAADFGPSNGAAIRADAAILPSGGAAYLSGVPAAGGLTESAVARAMQILLNTLRQLNLSPADIVQIKVFLSPASSAEDVLRQIDPLFTHQPTPPVTFVEWLASVPVEIELVAQLPSQAKTQPALEYFTPADFRPSPGFSRAALVRGPRQIFTSGLSPRIEGTIGAQTRDVFRQLQEITAAAGSDMGHLAKGTYYTSADNASHALNKVRPEFFDPARPPAASKVMVHGVGQAGRTITIDMIAVGSDP